HPGEGGVGGVSSAANAGTGGVELHLGGGEVADGGVEEGGGAIGGAALLRDAGVEQGGERGGPRRALALQHARPFLDGGEARIGGAGGGGERGAGAQLQHHELDLRQAEQERLLQHGPAGGHARVGGARVAGVEI